jgi:hypothetical protein
MVDFGERRGIRISASRLGTPWQVIRPCAGAENVRANSSPARRVITTSR